MTQERKTTRECPLCPGQIVRSKAGRDKGDDFLVLDVIDAKHVWVVDGKARPLQRPKKKRVIHLQRTHRVIENFLMMKKDRTFHDARVRALVRPYQVSQEESQNVE